MLRLFSVKERENHKDTKGTKKIIKIFVSLCLCGYFLFCNVGLTFAQNRPAYSKDEPIGLDFDMESIPEPKGYDTGYFYDFADGTFFQQVKQAFDIPRQYRNLSGKPKEAYNVNTLGEVPDSSWFTNRNGMKPMSIEEIKRGPNKNSGPVDGKLTVVKAKTRGAQPGLWIKDEKGDVYILKFDPPEYPEMATSAEIISTKLFYAIGYNVPENHIFRFSRDQLRLEEKKDSSKDKKKEITEAVIDEVLKRVARQPDGRYRCLASKFLSGKVKGNFTFHGLQEGDRNDIIPHEDRRDLRGLRLFSAWLNHVDMRTENTMNLYITEDGRKFIRHYLFDFGATLGSFSTKPKMDWLGHENSMDGKESMKAFFTLGTYPQPWLGSNKELRYPSVGFFDSKYFEPNRWKQLIPLVAFENMTDKDAYWAAKIIGSFKDEQIKAAVEAGELSDPEAAAYLTDQLIQRRDKIVREYYSRVPALDQFKAERSGDGYNLLFRDLRKEVFDEIRKKEGIYEYELRSASEPGLVIDSGTTSTEKIAFSRELLEKIGKSGKAESERGVARLCLKRRGEEQEVQVYLYYEAARGLLRIVGINN